jgi:hypothetical protein
VIAPWEWDDEELEALYEFGEDEDQAPDPPYPVQPWAPDGGWQPFLFDDQQLAAAFR